jgi:hypothetical protein
LLQFESHLWLLLQLVDDWLLLTTDAAAATLLFLWNIKLLLFLNLAEAAVLFKRGENFFL